MDTEQVGSFRTRTAGDGSLEVWARGWRLESPLYALIPVGLALMFVLAPMPLPMRAGGALVMLAAGLFVFRLQKPGLSFAQDAVTVVGVVRTRRFAWDGVSGFMGERRHDEGRVLLVLEGDERVPLPGTLDPSELDPYGEEGEMLSAVDQLNRLGERARAGQLPRHATTPSAAKRPKEAKVSRVRLPKAKARKDDATRTPSEPAVAVSAARTDLMERPVDSNHPTVVRAPRPLDDGGPSTRKQQRNDRKELRKALKAVKLTKDGRAIAPMIPTSDQPAEPAASAAPQRRLLGRRQPAEPLSQVPISAPAVSEAPSRPPAVTSDPAPEGLPNHYPTPTYIPQEEYARMLREQRAAEKAAAAAAAELRELAEPDATEPEELSSGNW